MSERSEAEKREAIRRLYGTHGERSGWNSGCRCRACLSAAPAGAIVPPGRWVQDAFGEPLRAMQDPAEHYSQAYATEPGQDGMTCKCSCGGTTVALSREEQAAWLAVHHPPR